jgi:UDP-N-acetylglucosamine 2-epimerase (non-hydrolysing)
VFKVGNPIKEVLNHYKKEINESEILMKLGVMPWHWDRIAATPYALLTFHRTENVDNKKRARHVIDAVNVIAEDMPVIFPMHPRTKDQFKKHGFEMAFSDKVIITEPIGFFDCTNLEMHARVVLTDSGTIPETSALFYTPCIVLRDTTERQELMENGSFILSGTKTEDILRAYKSISKLNQQWVALDDYNKTSVSDTVIRILLGQ